MELRTAPHGSRANQSHYFPYYVPLAERGWDVVLPEYRGYPPNGGERSFAALLEDLGPMLAWTRREAADPERIALLGISLGSTLALHAAAEHGPVAAVVVEDVIDPARALRAHFGSSWWARRKAGLVGALALPSGAAPGANAARSSAPLLIVQGLADQRWIVEAAREVAAAAGGPAVLWELSRMGHAPDTLFQLGAPYVEAVHGFLRGALERGEALLPAAAVQAAAPAARATAARLTAERLHAADPLGRSAAELAALVPPGSLPRSQEALLLPLLLDAARDARRAGDREGARAFLRRAQRAAPHDPRAFYWMDGSTYRLGDPHAARRAEVDEGLRE